MKTGKPFYGWVLAVTIPALAIIAGGIVIINGVRNSPGIEITLTSPRLTLFSNGITGTPDTPEKININIATKAELETLPDIGEVRAAAIVDYRNLNGAFKDSSDLVKVPGITARILKNISGLITVN
jgi:competence ComEA-like helix-hairpin-helix protein